VALRFARLLLIVTALADPARAQTLGVEGGHFTVDGKGRFLTFLSYFDALRATDVEGDFAFIRQQAAFDGVRVFPNWWIYTGTPPNCPRLASDTLFDDQGRIRGDNGDALAPSGRLQRLIQVLRAAQRQGLIVDLSFARETVRGDLTIAEYRQALRRLAVLLREYRHVIIDIQNERDNGGTNQRLTHDDVRSIKQAIKSADPARLVMASMGGTTTSPGEPDNAGTATGFNIRAETDAIAYHDARGAGWHDRTTTVVQSLRQMAPFPLKPVYLQEPTRWRLATTACGTAETDSSDADPEHFRTALRLARQAGAAAWTFHTQRTFRLAGTSSLRSQILALPAGNAERELYLGPRAIHASAGR
jgi:hypothetical protein